MEKITKTIYQTTAPSAPNPPPPPAATTTAPPPTHVVISTTDPEYSQITSSSAAEFIQQYMPIIYTPGKLGDIALFLPSGVPDYLVAIHSRHTVFRQSELTTMALRYQKTNSFEKPAHRPMILPKIEPGTSNRLPELPQDPSFYAAQSPKRGELPKRINNPTPEKRTHPTTKRALPATVTSATIHPTHSVATQLKKTRVSPVDPQVDLELCLDPKDAIFEPDNPSPATVPTKASRKAFPMEKELTIADFSKVDLFPNPPEKIQPKDGPLAHRLGPQVHQAPDINTMTNPDDQYGSISRSPSRDSSCSRENLQRPRFIRDPPTGISDRRNSRDRLPRHYRRTNEAPYLPADLPQTPEDIERFLADNPDRMRSLAMSQLRFLEGNRRPRSAPRQETQREYNRDSYQPVRGRHHNRDRETRPYSTEGRRSFADYGANDEPITTKESQPKI
jgi:hypothetical protein